jgi:hypothetical protein
LSPSPEEFDSFSPTLNHIWALLEQRLLQSINNPIRANLRNQTGIINTLFS